MNEQLNFDFFPDHILVLIGLSASGKDTLQKYLIDNMGYSAIVSTTSRPKRIGEIEGVNYYYISNEEFVDMMNKDMFIECREYHTLVDGKPSIWMYGVEKHDINLKDKKVVILDKYGFEMFAQYFGREYLNVIYLKSNAKLRKKRCKLRGDFNEQEWKRREEDDKKTFDGVEQQCDYIITNNFESAEDFLKYFKEIIDNKKVKL